MVTRAAPRKEEQEHSSGCWQRAAGAVGYTTQTPPYRSERQRLKKPRGLFSKSELCTQAGSIFVGKCLKRTSLRNLLYLSKPTKTQIDTANISEEIQGLNDCMDLTFNIFMPQFSSVKWG